MSEWITTCNRRPEWLSRDDPEPENDAWTLTIVWSAAQPERIGEQAVIDGARAELVLGRGGATAADPSERLHFMRQRPGIAVPLAPLDGAGLSRRQCLVRAGQGGVSVQNVGRAPMFVQGKRRSQAVVDVDDLITIEDQLILYCSRRAASPRLRYFDPIRASQFGRADDFGIVGEHPACWELREQLAFFAASDKHVLILGESGTGKELAARALHQMSPRGRLAMVARNAATFPSTLIDAELFGNAANYPNAGMPARSGVIGQAHGTTLFLDEIAELPTELQAHLLRVLDHGGEYQRLGDAQMRHSDFRLVAATNRDPTELRLDILGRLTLQLQLPSLQDRRSDVALLIRHLLLKAAEGSPDLLDRFCADTASGPEPRIDPQLLEALLRHDYTYNVRELERLLWTAVSTSPRNFVAMSAQLREEMVRAPVAPAPSTTPVPAREPTPEEIIDCLNGNAQHVARTATALGLKSRYALYRLMRKHGIAVERSG